MNLILWPAVITLAITLLRLVGELQGWSPTYFNKAAGGGGALVGISWLPLVFGPFFAWTLAKQGKGPANAWKVVGIGLGCIALVVGASIAASKLFGPVGQISTFVLASIAITILAIPTWKDLGRTLLLYAFAARIPVVIVMLFAIFGKWGTHYDVLPPNPSPELATAGPLGLWFWIGVVPQMTLWIAFTVVVGMIFGALTVALLKPKPGA